MLKKKEKNPLKKKDNLDEKRKMIIQIKKKNIKIYQIIF